MANKIGIGITTTPNRKKHLLLCLEQIQKHTSIDVDVFINEDVEGKGVAWAKNNCLKALKGHEYIFLFDDDCFPINDKWIDFYIANHLNSKEHHFLYLNHSHNLLGTYNGIESYNDCGGCFMFLTNEVVEKVGAFGDYGRYGFEHAGYSQRIHSAGLTTTPYLCPVNSSSFIHSLDLDSGQFDIKHHTSIPVDQCLRLINENAPKFDKDIETIYKPI